MTEPKPVTVTPIDGPLEVKIGADGIPSVHAKTISSHIEKILSFGIENIIDIRSYDIEHKDGKTFHSVVFNSGGTIELSFSPDGSDFQGSVSGMAQRIIDGERIVIREKPRT